MEMIIDLVLALKKVNIFSDIPDHILADIAKIIDVVEFQKGDQFIKQGEIGQYLYIIRKGSVAVHVGDHRLAELKENDIVGELSVLAPIKRTADVSATEDIILYRIEREYFLELLVEEPEIMKAILKVLVYRINNLNQRINSTESNS